MEAIRSLKGKFGESKLFAHEKDQSFKSSIATIYQTFDGIELYPSIEEKAAMLLYLVTKNHSFSDGNKRLRPCYSFGSWKITVFSIPLMEKKGLRIIPS